MDDSHGDWLNDALELVRSSTSLVPRVGIILGSGLGGFAAQVEADSVLPYATIPGFPVSTAIGHKGQLTLGHFAGCPVAVLEGRFHLYEGYSADLVVRPIHLLRALGAELLIATNAAGGLNPGLRVGDVVVVEDHVNLMWTGPTVAFRSAKERCFAERKATVDETTCGEPLTPGNYDPELAEWAMEAARLAGASCSRGVYIGMTGPNYETRAEYRWLRQVGDLVGMSTVPEVLVARELGIRVLALSVVSNECNPDALEPTDGMHVVAAVSRAEGRLRSIVRGVLNQWNRGSFRPQRD